MSLHRPLATCPPALLLLAALASPVVADIAGAPGRVHALTAVRIVAEPGGEPFEGTLLLRDGRIESIGRSLELPDDAIIHELPGRTIYAGWIEPYLVRTEPGTERGEVAHENARVRPERRAVDGLPLEEELREELRKAGYTTAMVVPGTGIFRGVTSVVSTADGDADECVVRAEHAQAFALEHASWAENSYPGSLMGAIALARQTLYDTQWHRDAWTAWEKNPSGLDRPEENVSWRALRPVLDGDLPMFLFSDSVAQLPRVLQIAEEFSLRPVVVSQRPDHFRRLRDVVRWLDESGADLITSLRFPEPPSWDGDDAAHAIELEALLDWERAPGDPAALADAGVDFAFTSHGLKSRSDVVSRVRTAVDAGLSRRAALAALTTRPAALLGVDHRVGTLEPGKDANLLIATGDVFEDGTEIEAVWIEGVRHGEIAARATLDDVSKKWELTIGSGAATRRVTVALEEKDGKPTGSIVSPGESADTESENSGPQLQDVDLTRGVLTFTIPAAPSAGEQRIRLERDGPFLRGEARMGGGEEPVLARAAREAKDDEPEPMLSARAEAWPPVYDPEGAPSVVVVRNATIWTSGDAGILRGTDLRCDRGRITAIGKGLDVPNGAHVIDGTGLHVTPGLIDCHSHSSVSGGVNECTESCTSEVRIADVVDANSVAIYRELAGGLTISNLLHGSCNVIGGQNAVIKLRWGQPAEDLLLHGAPGGIKFALGENVKRSNWDEENMRDRYPKTRMGIEQFLRDRFHAAADYRNAWEDWRRSKKGAPPRRDLELDALVEILQGDRLIHCHSYRADEIIMLIRVAEDFGFRVGTFQHVLEGYKCANEIAAHGAGASAFSDWWSYKYEVVDAIPYNGEIMWRRGVNVSYNSDSSELSRRMNLEATKAVKYGGVPDEEALHFVTRNPAMQLGIADRVGTLEKGKDADFVLWSAPPLSDFAVCQQTWIDGVKRFDRAEDLAAREAAMELRRQLLAKAERAEDASGDSNGNGSDGFWDEGSAVLRQGDCVEFEACCGGGE